MPIPIPAWGLPVVSCARIRILSTVEASDESFSVALLALISPATDRVLNVPTLVRDE